MRAARGKLLVLLNVAVGLFALLLVELEGATTSDTQGAPAMANNLLTSAAFPAPAALHRQDAQHVATILARPLFRPDRRPEASVAQTTVGGPGRLTGVTISPVAKAAIFAGSAGSKPIVVDEGGRVGSYTVIAIEIGAVTIMGPEGQRVLHPSFDPSLQPKAVGSAVRQNASK